MQYETTAIGHVYEILTLAAVLAVLGTFAYIEYRRKKNAPKPRGATKI